MTPRTTGEHLAEIARRIDALVSAQPLVTRPIRRAATRVRLWLGWRPHLRTTALSALHAARALSGGQPAAFPALLGAAVAELDHNLTELERAREADQPVDGRSVTWLWRACRSLHALSKRSGNDPGRPALEVLDPLIDAPSSSADAAAPSSAAPQPGAAARARAVDPLLLAARAETDDLERRRRLLEAARELLFDAAASLSLDAKAVSDRHLHIARDIEIIDRLQAAGLDPRVGLRYQLRRAAGRNDAGRVHAALSALHAFAESNGDARLGELTRGALDAFWAGKDRRDPVERRRSLQRSGEDAFGEQVMEAIAAGYRQGRKNIGTQRKAAVELAAKSYFDAQGVPATIRAALAVDGCFDVGSGALPARAIEEQRRPRRVSFPTAHMDVVPTSDITDLPTAIIEDPRTLIPALASGRLLTRRYAADEVVRRSRTVLKSEARIYVLDGSGSMRGARGRMRDAILVAELATVAARLQDRHRTLDPVLYYRYFNDQLGPICRVRSQEDALAAIRDVLSTFRTGGTNIQRALRSSFEQIAEQKATDPELARAQIVLVTDGRARVSQRAVLSYRKKLGDLAVGISIIALGQENPALRSLAAAQRAMGERVFYQFLSDDALAQIVQGHPPPAIHPPEAVDAASALDRIRDLLDQIDADHRGVDTDRIARTHEERLALEHLGLSLERDHDAAERARFELAARDQRAIERRFSHWFAEAARSGARPSVDPPTGGDADDLQRLIAALEAVTEILHVIGGDALERRLDAIEVFEQLLMDAGLPPRRYAELGRRFPERLAPAVAAVRAAADAGACP